MRRRLSFLGLVMLLVGCIAQPASPVPVELGSSPQQGASREAVPRADHFLRAELTDVSTSIVAPGSSALLGPMPHEYQTLNNCAPTSLAMLLSYFDEPTTQAELVPILKGGPADKNVSPRELTAYVRQRGFEATLRINGDLERLMTLLANGFPVIVEQWLETPDDALTGHYRVVRGFDRARGVMIVNDSYLGPKVEISFGDFDRWWRAFNRLYIVVYPRWDRPLVRAILGEDWAAPVMYRRAAEAARAEIATLADAYAWLNLGNAYLGLGQADQAVTAFERAMEIGLPARMLWYQFGPFQAYLEAGHYDRVLRASEALIAQHPELEELQYWRGMAYLKLGRRQDALNSLRAALFYNPHFQPALEALSDNFDSE